MTEREFVEQLDELITGLKLLWDTKQRKVIIEKLRKLFNSEISD